MTEDGILDEVRRVLRDKLKRTGPVERETGISTDLAIDSLDQLGLVVEIENHFEICFEPDGSHPVETIGDVVDEIARCLRRKGDEDRQDA